MVFSKKMTPKLPQIFITFAVIHVSVLCINFVRIFRDFLSLFKIGQNSLYNVLVTLHQNLK